MSRIGRAPIELVQGVTVDETVDGIIVVTGPKGTLRRPVENCVKLEHTEHNGIKTSIPTIPNILPPTDTATRTQMEGSPTEFPTTWG